MDKAFLTVAEVAVTLGITTSAAWQRLYRGALPYKRWGRRVLIPVAELQHFLDALPGRSAAEAVAVAAEVRHSWGKDGLNVD